ncbi:MAG: hypothetical protein SFW66_05790 [Gammaproteobacteria bacterium]|nr:hypothetical protein [Gammaproteobacteria bacterium]
MTEQDEKQGLVKTYWTDARKQVATIEPELAAIIDKLSPDHNFPLYLAYYPYGAITGDTQSAFFPTTQGEYYRLTDLSAPKEIQKNLAYSVNNAPLTLILEKQIECFVDLKSSNITMPIRIRTPGYMYPYSRILPKRNKRIYAPNGVLSAVAGTRSVFLLPSIGCATNHSSLQRDFNVQNSAPKSLYQHWNIFCEIINNKTVQSNWNCCLLFFSENWIKKLHEDKSWAELKKHLHEKAWHQFEYDINRVSYDMIFSFIQQERNLKPNPYLADTAKHLFATALGAVPGFTPAMNEEALPLAALQEAFVHSYGMHKYYPTIMQPQHFNFENDKTPIYYSLHHPSVHVFAPKSRKISSTLVELRELEHIMRVFARELGREDSMCSDTILSKIARETRFNYFHSKPDKHKVVKDSQEIAKQDKRFRYCSARKKPGKNMVFASDAPFVRGCVSISSK